MPDQPQTTADSSTPAAQITGSRRTASRSTDVHVPSQSQPQPAALSDAEVLDKFQRTIGDFWVKGPDVSTAHEIQRLRSLLEFRLARAESAPGVTVDRGALYRLWKHAQGQHVPPVDLERAAELALAALADAGTEAE